MHQRKKKAMGADTFAIVNESTNPDITDEVIDAWIAALEKQSSRDFAPAWRQTPSQFVRATSEDVQSLTCHTTILKDKIPEAPSALAYHTINAKGQPVLVLGVDVCAQEAKASGKDLLKSVIPSAISHEACEERGNEYVELNVDMPDGAHDTAREACDWTQGDLYDIDGYDMSNFVYPEFFDASIEAGTKLDHMGLCTKPLVTRPNGYAVIRSVKDGRSRMVFGETVPEHVREKKIVEHINGNSRHGARRKRKHGHASLENAVRGSQDGVA